LYFTESIACNTKLTHVFFQVLRFFKIELFQAMKIHPRDIYTQVLLNQVSFCMSVTES